jgi:hypothetical protein
MARYTQFQTNFSVGEMDPLLRARTDLEQYSNGLESAKNVVIHPQGGATRRPGLRTISKVYDNPFAQEFKLIPFQFSRTDTYLLAVQGGLIKVFKNDVFQVNVSAGDITSAMVPDLKYTQAVDTLIIVHQDMHPKRLVRNSDVSWTFEDLPLTFIPTYAFSPHFHYPQFTITPSAVDGNITLTASGGTTDTGTAQGGSSNTIQLKAATSFTGLNTPVGMNVTLTGGTGSGQSKHVHEYDVATKTITIDGTWTTAPDATTTYKVVRFGPSTVGEIITRRQGGSFNGGQARVVQHVSDNVVDAIVQIPFFDATALTNPIAGPAVPTEANSAWQAETGYESTWSDTLGWPRTASFYESRLYFGGTALRPNTLWGSKVAQYFDFDAGTGLDDEAVEATLNVNEFNEITNLNAGPDLQIFTSGGEFVVIQEASSPVTPATFMVKPQTQIGSKPGLPVVNIGGSAVFIQRQGQSLVSMQYNQEQGGYGILPLSTLSSHLLKTPIDMARRRAVSTDEADQIYILNEADSSITLYSILPDQNVIAPSRIELGVTNPSQYTFVSIAVVVSDVYVLVKYDPGLIGVNVEGHILKFDSSVFTDYAVTGTSASSGAMNQPNVNNPVKVIGDGVVEPNTKTGPTVNFDRTYSTWEFGIDFDVEIKTMPVEPRLASGSVFGLKKRIVQVDAPVYESQNMVINNQPVAFREFGAGILDAPVAEFTGTKTVRGLLGFSQTSQITVTQSVPLKLTLLGLEYRVSIGN